MKRLKKAAVTMAAFLTAISIASCERKNVVSTDTAVNTVQETTVVVGENKIYSKLGESVQDNETVFTVNSIISPEELSNEGRRYIYFDVTINNNSDSAYSLSTLNNFYITTGDGTEIYEDISTQLYAMSHFKDDVYFSDPFEVPANSEFKGIIGGFLVYPNTENFTVGFFPTKGSPTAKGDVILIDFTAADIKTPDASILK